MSILDIEKWVEKTTEWFATASGKTATASHVETVKKYSPHIMHVVLDLRID